MKRTLLFLLLFVVASAGSWAQKLDLNRVIDLENHHWTDKVSGRLSASADIDHLIGNPSHELLAIDNDINDLLHQDDMTQRDFFQFVQRIFDHGRRHHDEMAQCNILLGNLYRFARPIELRNIRKAEEYYLAAIDLLPAGDHKSRGEIFYVLADCYNYDEGQANLHKMARYMHAAAVEYPRLASAIGDLYLCGWSVYQDYYLAASAYDIARLYGDTYCYTSTRVVQYLVEHPFLTMEDSIAYADFERYLYFQRISPDNAKALYFLQSAADKGFVPAYCILAGICYDRAQKTPEGLQRDRLRQQAFDWYKKGIEANYSPARVEMASLCMEWCADTAKGLINSPDQNGNYPSKAVVKSYRQALELLTYAAEHDNIIAMCRLGDLYLEGGAQNTPARNIDQAVRWYVDAARRSNPIAKQKLLDLVNREIISADYEQKYQDVISNAGKSEDNYDLRLFQLIRRSNSFRDYHLLQSSVSSEYNTMTSLGVKEDPILYFYLNQGYHVVYKLYEQLISDLSDRIYSGQSTLNDDGSYFQLRMKDIRERYTRIMNDNVVEPITPSVLESWHPQK